MKFLSIVKQYYFVNFKFTYIYILEHIKIFRKQVALIEIIKNKLIKKEKKKLLFYLINKKSRGEN